MDASTKDILLIILPPISAILSALITSIINIKTLKENNNFQINRDEHIYQREVEKTRKEQTKKDLIEVYKNLCLLQREFSLTSMNIDWSANIHEQEYNKKYFELCNSFDNSRATIAISFPELLSDFDKVYGEMNIYWGNFNNLLRQNRLGKTLEEQAHWHQQTFDISQEIVQLIQDIKYKLTKAELF